MPSRNRGAKSRRQTLRTIKREAHTAAGEAAMFETLTSGSATEVAIVGLSLVEIRLDELMRTRFFPSKDPEVYERLTDAAGPLATIFQKVELGYALGLYDDMVRENFRLAARIRNVFAHPPNMVSWDHPAIVEELRGIKVKPRARDNLSRMLSTRQHEGRPLPPRFVYTILIGWLFTSLTNRTKGLLKQKIRRRHAQAEKAKAKRRGLLTGKFAAFYNHPSSSKPED